jgi:hypothetical protein
MSTSFTDFTSDDFAKAIQQGIQLELEAAIVKELTDVVMPKIKDLAKKAARDVCERGRAKIVHDQLTQELRAYVSFDSGKTVERT